VRGVNDRIRSSGFSGTAEPRTAGTTYTGEQVRAERERARSTGTPASFSDGPRFADGGMVPPFADRHSAIQFAKGGSVPVGGKMVVDPDPNAPTDSIPAMIDGQRPAALDSGEFVIPRHAVMFHGIDKLNKLIAQAEKEPADVNAANT
jgi:hypothetical protein